MPSLLRHAAGRNLLITVTLGTLAVAAPSLAQDQDGDGTPDAFDNCVAVANGPTIPDPGGNVQHDTNLEGFGNVCDADYTNDGIVGGSDYILLSASFGCGVGDGCYDPDLDFDGDGGIGGEEIVFISQRFGSPPGPSGLACAGTPPCPLPTVSISSPEDGDTTTASSTTVSGTVSPDDTPVDVVGIAATVTGGSFTATGVPLGSGTNEILAEATLLGATVSDAILVVRVQNAPPPPPDLPAPPPLDPTVASSIFAATEFLYTGASPVQTGVTPGAITVERAALVRGRVLKRNGTALPSVQVSVKGHSEFGQTLTRGDGMFDLVIDGGGVFTLEYVREGYLPVHRQVEALWQDARFVDEVVMIPGDPVRNEIVQDDGAYQVARGSVESDYDGTRQATVLFPPGTTATLTPGGLADSPFIVRATEYTVGDDGPKTMPAELPPTSGYTYAVELGIDEAVDAGAEVAFNQPVQVYLENFLDFQVGSAVPVGTYDLGEGAWVPEDSGIVLEILSETNDLANLDVDGSGTPATGGQLTALGITDEERETLAAVYEPGQTLWRVSSTHFSTSDKNKPRMSASAPEDAVQPDQDDALAAANDGRCDPNNECAEGSLIRIQNQSLGESVPVVGTPFRLHYSSERVPGRKLGGTHLVVPLTDATVPPSLLGVELEVQVAGRRFQEPFGPQPDQTFVFDDWDGLDAYGRRVQGRQQATVRIGYEYEARYQEAGRFFATNFGEGTPGARLARTSIVLSRTHRVMLGSWDARAQGMGGWTLDVHHAYDPVGRVVYRGDGTRQDGLFLLRQVRPIAGGQTLSTTLENESAGDGGEAISAKFNQIADLVVGEDGSIFVLTSGLATNRIRKIDPAGDIDTLYGGASGCTEPSGEDDEAALACFPGADDIDRGPDGTLYLSYDGSPFGFTQRITPAGTLERFAGDPSSPTGPEGPREQVGLDEPADIAAAPDGAVYIGEVVGPTDAVGVVTRDDLYTLMAGDPSGGVPAEDVPALDGEILVEDLDVGPDGSVYIAGQAPNGISDRVWRVFPDGRIEKLAGAADPDLPEGLGDGGPATEAKLIDIQRIAVTPDGGVYIATGKPTAATSPPAPDAGPRIRFVSPSGIISTVVGDGAPGAPDFQTASETTSIGAVVGMDVAPDGALIIATEREFFDNSVEVDETKIFEITGAVPGVGTADVVILSADRTQTFVFDSTGKHKETRHALTDEVLLAFEYHETTGYLTTITDFDGKVTTIQRSGANPTAIVSHFGPATLLGTNMEGFLSAITNPAGETIDLGYHGTEGLLASFERPSDDASTFTYDSLGLGLLERDDDAKGGFTELESTVVGNRTTVEVETALGRISTYELEELSGVGQERILTDPADLPTHQLFPESGGEDIRLPDGTQIVRTVVRYPRPGGIQAPVTDTLTVSTPDGRQLAVDVDWEGSAPFVTLTQRVSLNGNPPFERVFTEATREFVTTTPEGRTLTETIDGAGRTTRIEVPGIEPVDFVYEPGTGRLTDIVQDDGVQLRRTQLLYDDPADQGFLSRVIDPVSREVAFDYDAAGRVTRQLLPGPGSPEIGFSYDENGNLATLTPPGKPMHLFRYDAIDQLSEYEPPAAGVPNPITVFDRDLDRRLDLVTRPDGATVDLQYDPATGRLEHIVRPAGTTTFGYDEPTDPDPDLGPVTSIAAPGGEGLAFDYDGFLLTGTTWSGTASGSVSHVYDDFLRVEREEVVGFDAAPGLLFQYDDDGLLTDAGDLAITRDPMGAMNGLIAGTTLQNVTTTRTPNAFGELAFQAASHPGAGTLYSEDVSLRNAAGQIRQKIETVAGGPAVTTDHDYDARGRLETVDVGGVPVRVYRYDDNGNRLSVSA